MDCAKCIFFYKCDLLNTAMKRIESSLQIIISEKPIRLLPIDHYNIIKLCGEALGRECERFKIEKPST